MRAKLALMVLAAVLSGAACRRPLPSQFLKTFDQELSQLQERLDAYPPEFQNDAERKGWSDRVDASVRSLREMMKKFPNRAELEWRLGECYRLGYNLDWPDSWPESKRWLEQALRHDPKSVPAHESLGFLYVDTGKEWAAAAEEEFLEALRFSGGERDAAYYGLFFAQVAQDKLEEALDSADAYLERVPDDREFRARRDAVEKEIESGGSVGDEPAPPVKT
jgi:tetratricopeptide (TPR) repeat protein